MDLLSTAFFTFYIVLSTISFTAAVGYFTYRGVKAHLGELKLGRDREELAAVRVGR